MWKKLLAGAAALAVAVPFAGYVGGKLQTVRWQRYAPWVGATYWDMRSLRDRLVTQQGMTAGDASEIVELLACSSIPTFSTYQASAELAAGVVRLNGVSPRAAVIDVLGSYGKPPALAEAALSQC